MREIKFRAWDKKLKKMFEFELEWSKYVNHEEIQCLTPVGVGNPNVENIEKPSDLMLYTGLKDKNGKEIYEADIIKYPQDSAYPNKFDYMVIEWENDYDGFGGLNCGFRMGGDYATQKNTEIVGNIFENPELIH